MEQGSNRLQYVIILLLSVCFSMLFPTSVQAAMQGTGTGSDPYQITDATDLYEFRDIVKTNSSAYAKLMKDITLNENVVNSNYVPMIKDFDSYTGNIWIPIGNSSTGYSGMFDGQGHSISGLVWYSEGDTDTYGGLFAKITTSGTVKNLNIEQSIYYTAKNSNYGCGGIAAESKGNIEDCHVKACIVGATYVGGIVAINYGTVSRCSVGGQVSVNTGTYSLGGIVGKSRTKAVIKDCYTESGTVIKGQDENDVGGLVGWNEGRLQNSLNLATISESIQITVFHVMFTMIFMLIIRLVIQHMIHRLHTHLLSRVAHGCWLIS